MLCRYELKDPRKCLKEGKDVTKCAIEGFQDIKKHCGSEFQAHVDCVINTSSTASNDEQYVNIKICYPPLTKKFYDEYLQF